ncbi:unnamed protein product [Diplocarpon coronariae]
MGEESLVAVGESASQIRNESQSDHRRHGNLFVCVEQTLEPRSSEAAEEQRSEAGQPAGRGTRTSPMDRESGAVPPHPPAPAGRPPFPEARVPEARRRAAARQGEPRSASSRPPPSAAAARPGLGLPAGMRWRCGAPRRRRCLPEDSIVLPSLKPGLDVSPTL